MAQLTTEKKRGNGEVKKQGENRGDFSFIPKRAFFEKESLDYPAGQKAFQTLKELGVDIGFAGSHNRITGIPGKTAREAYIEGKRTMVVGVRRTLNFESCKPSAHYQLPLVTSCPGMCEYCYLNTTLGKKPYIRVYVNVDEILAKAKQYIKERIPEITFFEGAATSDPLPVEPYIGSLAKTIEFFGGQTHGRFRFVTKFTNVEPLLTLEHGGHTRFRFSVNARSIIDNYEKGTPRLIQRLDAAEKVYKADYPTGFIIGPIITFEGWEDQYLEMFQQLGQRFGNGENLTLELITHRFTKRAKSNILEVFPETTLPMDETERKFKYGQFGYGKYVYPSDTMEVINRFMTEMVENHIPRASIEYSI